jgi:hypothetical protein
MGMSYAGSLSGAAPVVRNFLIGETMYEGQLAMTGLIAGTAGAVQIADVASEANENDQCIIGLVTGVVDGSRTYNSTYRGHSSTFTTTQATVAANGPAEVQVTLIRPWDTLIKAPICYTAYGTAPTVLTNTTASAGGVVVTHAGETITDTADDLCIVYCRTGANRGLWRVVTTGATGSQTTTLPFPYAIAVGDTFVKVACVPGLGALDIIATANCINGDAAHASYYPVFYHEINCEVAGQEYAVFSFLPAAQQSASI